MRKAFAVLVILAIGSGILFYSSWKDGLKADPYKTGRELAERDIAAGNLSLKGYGPPRPAWHRDYVKLLKERHGIEVVGVAGCTVTPEFSEEVKGYNDRMNQEVASRFGADVFNNAVNEVRPVIVGDDH